MSNQTIWAMEGNNYLLPQNISERIRDRFGIRHDLVNLYMILWGYEIQGIVESGEFQTSNDNAEVRYKLTEKGVQMKIDFQRNEQSGLDKIVCSD